MNSISTTNLTVRIRQFGQPLAAFHGCRFVKAGDFTGTIAGVACFASVTLGDVNDRRRGRSVTPDDLRGPFSIELIDSAGVKVATVGVGSLADVAAHPNGIAALSAR